FFFVEAITDQGLRQEVETYLVGWRKSVATALRRAQERGDLPEDIDRKAIATDLVGLADGLSLHGLLDEDVMARLREHSPIRFWIRRLTTSGETTNAIDPAEQEAVRAAG
ncbi:MAG: hypothetical protein EOS64_21565, partial [Mesorhizobium sp.]